MKYEDDEFEKWLYNREDRECIEDLIARLDGDQEEHEFHGTKREMCEWLARMCFDIIQQERCLR